MQQQPHTQSPTGGLRRRATSDEDIPHVPGDAGSNAGRVRFSADLGDEYDRLPDYAHTAIHTDDSHDDDVGKKEPELFDLDAHANDDKANTSRADVYSNSRASSYVPKRTVTKPLQHPSDGGGSDRTGRSRTSDSEFSDRTGATNTSAASSTAQAARNAGITRFKICGKTIRVSFVAWTLLAMSIPVLFLVAATGYTTGEAVNELNDVRRFMTLARSGSRCVSFLCEEESAQARRLVARAQIIEDVLAELHAGIQTFCIGQFQPALVDLAAKDERFDPYMQTWMDASASIREARDDWRPLPLNMSAAVRVNALKQVVQKFNGAERAVTNLLARAADEIGTADGRRLIDIKMSADMRKALYDTLSIGFLIVGYNRTDYTDAVLSMYDAARQRQASAVTGLLEMGTTTMRNEFTAWRSQNHTNYVLELLDAEPHEFPTIDPYAWYFDTLEAVARLQAVEDARVSELERADRANAKLSGALAIMLAGIATCTIAASLLVWQQIRTKRELETQVERSERTRRAISAFVPKFFLSKMGYTSITQVQVGESTDVALAMLFSDVRQFTRVSEGMASAALFQWVQGYFRRMTTIVEANRGNINQFIGDALFAVFSSCADSVACAVEMQSDAQQLNIERLCEDGNSVPIEIGVGLHHDVLATGILGDARRHTCTAISASVNLASRLEGLTKQLGCRILASEAVMTQLSEAQRAAVAHRRVGPAVVKGSCLDVVIFDVFQTDERDLQAYKAETKEDFERYARLVLVPDGESVAPEHVANELRRALIAAAEARDTVDPVLGQMLKYRNPALGTMAFDEK